VVVFWWRFVVCWEEVRNLVTGFMFMAGLVMMVVVVIRMFLPKHPLNPLHQLIRPTLLLTRQPLLNSPHNASLLLRRLLTLLRYPEIRSKDNKRKRDRTVACAV